jgi:hypothetical protein
MNEESLPLQTKGLRLRALLLHALHTFFMYLKAHPLAKASSYLLKKNRNTFILLRRSARTSGKRHTLYLSSGLALLALLALLAYLPYLPYLPFLLYLHTTTNPAAALRVKQARRQVKQVNQVKHGIRLGLEDNPDYSTAATISPQSSCPPRIK